MPIAVRRSQMQTTVYAITPVSVYTHAITLKYIECSTGEVLVRSPKKRASGTPVSERIDKVESDTLANIVFLWYRQVLGKVFTDWVTINVTLCTVLRNGLVVGSMRQIVPWGYLWTRVKSAWLQDSEREKRRNLLKLCVSCKSCLVWIGRNNKGNTLIKLFSSG